MNYRVKVFFPTLLDEFELYEGPSYEVAEHRYNAEVARMTTAHEGIRLIVLMRLTPEPIMEDLTVQVHIRSRQQYEWWKSSRDVPSAIKAAWTTVLGILRE